MQENIRWIAIDWGSTQLRAYAMDEHNVLMCEKISADGMASLAPEAFEPALVKLIEDWLPQDPLQAPVTVIACGMVGARQGWQEAPYLQTPCHPTSSKHIITIATQDPRMTVKVLSGVCQTSPADIMRGEETQIAGLIREDTAASGAVCLPGTHSKWVSLHEGNIQHFTTYMTGEIFALLSEHSMLRHTVASTDWDDAAFLDGIACSIKSPQDLLSHCFRLRAQDMLHHLPAASAKSTLSGLIIGAELAGAAPFWQTQTVNLIGELTLSRLYAIALESLGVTAHVFNPKTLTLYGLAQAYQALNKP